MKNMSHEEVIEQQVVEQYLLKELSEQQVVEFEDHYFGCPACARDVQHGQTLIDAMKT